MPSKEAHLSAARENQHALDYLCERIQDFPAWATTVTFYKALHVVEALFAADGAGVGGHTDEHKERNRLLKTTPRYHQIWKFYRLLFQASLIARYLRENENTPTYEVFSKWLPPEAVTRLVVGHWLRQIEKSAARLSGEDVFEHL